ncbi:protein of unknown function [Clostridium beijerinckii]|nr:protein of unknown function [Clostridium beijerinckii]
MLCYKYNYNIYVTKIILHDNSKNIARNLALIVTCNIYTIILKFNPHIILI